MLNNNSTLFEEIFSEELISNESFRSKVLAGIIGFLIIVVLLLSFAFSKHFKDVSQFSITIEITLLILAIIFVRAIFVSRAAKKWNRFGVKAFILIRYINAFTEISIPSIVLIIYSFYLPSIYPLFTPVTLLYFLIIMLSALELDFKLCLFSGSVAALQYLIIAWFLSNKSPEIFDSTSIFPIHIGATALLFISGHTAGLITVH
ncbi:MAG: hypothetical protein RBR74_03990, partial [Ignavibacteriaceae bacterium]|nr:hypothetical protein [Ignavibacteriaceae bacterium]